MYAMMQQRKDNPATMDEIGQHAREDYFPKLRQAPGLVALYVISEAGGTHTAVAIWESQTQAEAFQAEDDRWDTTLEEHGHLLQSRSNGEVVGHVIPAA